MHKHSCFFVAYDTRSTSGDAMEHAFVVSMYLSGSGSEYVYMYDAKAHAHAFLLNRVGWQLLFKVYLCAYDAEAMLNTFCRMERRSSCGSECINVCMMLRLCLRDPVE